MLPEARHSQASATPFSTSAAIGFSTSALRVAVDRKTLELIIRDAAGRIIQQDALPLVFTGDSFRIAKVMAQDEHFFGLGDKTGPLDRRNQAFTLWNTDAYRFQESTDPIYKSIPFFMTYRVGLAVGVLLDNTWRSSFDFGKESRARYSFGAENGPIDYYVFNDPLPPNMPITVTFPMTTAWPKTNS